MDANDKADLSGDSLVESVQSPGGAVFGPGAEVARSGSSTGLGSRTEARLAAIEARLEILETFVVTLDLPEGTTRVLDRPGPHDHTKIPADGRTE